MSEMVERVARALLSEEWQGSVAPGLYERDKLYWDRAARAAMQAMRNPTEAMELAFNRQSAERFNWPMMWAAAVDTALTETDPVAQGN